MHKPKNKALIGISCPSCHRSYDEFKEGYAHAGKLFGKIYHNPYEPTSKESKLWYKGFCRRIQVRSMLIPLS